MDKIAQKSPFVMPDWMEPYREMFYSTGGNSVEYLIDALNIEGLAFSNAMLFSLALMAEAQVALLTRLHKGNALNNAAELKELREFVGAIKRMEFDGLLGRYEGKEFWFYGDDHKIVATGTDPFDAWRKMNAGEGE